MSEQSYALDKAQEELIGKRLELETLVGGQMKQCSRAERA